MPAVPISGVISVLRSRLFKNVKGNPRLSRYVLADSVRQIANSSETTIKQHIAPVLKVILQVADSHPEFLPKIAIPALLDAETANDDLVTACRTAAGETSRLMAIFVL